MTADFSLAGKHRGIVTDNADPLKLGRLKIRIDAAYGNQPVQDIPWAWPCFPSGGSPNCGFFDVPELGASVWVEFQWKDGQPDPTHPIWTGVWFAEGDTPEEVEGPPGDAHYYKVFKTPVGHVMTFCDKPGEEFIRLTHGKKKQTIEMDKDGLVVILSHSGKKIRLNPPGYDRG